MHMIDVAGLGNALHETLHFEDVERMSKGAL